jgi:hypothetical protein
MPVEVPGSSEGLGLILDPYAEPANAYGNARHTHRAQMLGGQDCVASVLGHSSLGSWEEHDSVPWKEAGTEDVMKEVSERARLGLRSVASEATP